jgi:hypothetical protein
MRRVSSIPSDIQPALTDALTELHAYALVLDGEREVAENRIAELDRAGKQPGELCRLRRRHAEITAQLDLLSVTITALRTRFDPFGRYL